MTKRMTLLHIDAGKIKSFCDVSIIIIPGL